MILSGHNWLLSVYTVVRPTQIFGIFQKKKKKRNDAVKPFFTSNNSFNLKNERSNSIEKKQEQKHEHFSQCILHFVNPMDL